jgi:hypothetical protein
MAFCVLWLASLLLLVSPSPRGVAMYSDLATKLPEASIILYAYVSALLL